MVSDALRGVLGLNIGHIVSLSYLLEPQVKYQFFLGSNPNNMTDNTRKLFLINPSNQLQQSIEKEDYLNISRVFQGSLSLMEVKKDHYP